MTTTDGPRFQTAIARLALIFPKQLEAETIRLYWDALKSYSIEQVEGAMAYIQNTKTESFFPVPGEIVDTIRTYFAAQPSRQIEYKDDTPPNEMGAAYMVYCLRHEKEWDWPEYARFKRAWADGRVKVERVEEVKQQGRVMIGGNTKVTWQSDITTIGD